MNSQNSRFKILWKFIIDYSYDTVNHIGCINVVEEILRQQSQHQPQRDTLKLFRIHSIPSNSSQCIDAGNPSIRYKPFSECR